MAALAAVIAMACAVALGGPGTASAQESYTAEIYLKDSNGNGLSGGTVLYRTGSSWNELGVTNEEGLATATLPKKDYRIRIEFRRGYIDTIDPIDITSHTFNTVKVHFLNSKEMHFRGYFRGFGSFSGPIELLPYTYDFSNQHNLKNQFELTIGPEGFTGGLLRLVDSHGDGLAGGSAAYYLGGWHNLPGTTDDNGNLIFEVPNDSSNLSIAMVYKGTREQQNRTQLDSSNFTFQTALVTVELRNADGDLFDTGHVTYYAGGWKTFGSGTTSGGTVTQEMLTGSKVSFAMSYNHSQEQKSLLTLSAPATTVTFQTGRLNLSYSESISWFASGWWVFTSGMEFLPGVQTFYLGTSPGNCSVDIPIASGDHLVKSGIVATLHTSAGAPLAGGLASAYAGGWKSIGTTDANGRACAALNGTLGNTTARMAYAGKGQNLTQHHPTNSIYAFETALVTVELRDSGGALIDTGSASYYGGGWKSLGATSGGVVTANMLPGNYSFAMVYNGTRQQLNGVAISGDTTVVTFTTTAVTVELRNSGGALIDTGSASYYAGGWRSIGNTSGGAVDVEMLPGSYSFAMVYNGTRQQLNGQAVSGPATTITFTTTAVTVELRDSGGNLFGTGSASYYAGGWRSIGNTADGLVTVEMLPGSYSFAMSYLGTRQQLNGQAIGGAASPVTFQTGKVHSVSGTATSYYAGGWKVFTNDMELLPGTYTFHFNDGTPNTAVTLAGGVINNIH